MKNFIKRAFLFVCFTVSFSIFADGNTSLVAPDLIEVNNFTQNDITAQIALREALKEVNFWRVRDLNAQKLALIDKDKLSWWDQMWDARIKELDRQIGHYEKQSKQYDNEIKKFTKRLK
ncbi:MAG: hypothetical protein LBQ88_21165 [Treponema sp.]|nr:hypothetical protein [Treponema sp.]